MPEETYGVQPVPDSSGPVATTRRKRQNRPVCGFPSVREYLWIVGEEHERAVDALGNVPSVESVETLDEFPDRVLVTVVSIERFARNVVPWCARPPIGDRPSTATDVPSVKNLSNRHSSWASMSIVFIYRRGKCYQSA